MIDRNYYKIEKENTYTIMIKVIKDHPAAGFIEKGIEDLIISKYGGEYTARKEILHALGNLYINDKKKYLACIKHLEAKGRFLLEGERKAAETTNDLVYSIKDYRLVKRDYLVQ